ncbi:hypothetical protein J7438_24235 [Thalassotalea sp. G20_0]|uniref:hypothetical protein n=1 Tax=Thalassotalea sp. G20_0 TaxID=2821093 RepID=UPI001ADAADA7|nr:hypothetical protein [Thalassotalea sp. G20_0]MBO9497171.1 hypothetical protein [Thalassotalea sp. G20_0]
MTDFHKKHKIYNTVNVYPKERKKRRKSKAVNVYPEERKKRIKSGGGLSFFIILVVYSDRQNICPMKGLTPAFDPSFVSFEHGKLSG